MRKKISEKMNPGKPGGMLRYGSEAWFAYYEDLYANDPAKLKKLAELKAKLLGNNNNKMSPDQMKGYLSQRPPNVKEAQNEMNNPRAYFNGSLRKPSGIMASPNPFDGGTNTPPAPAGTPGKPRPGDAGIDLAEKIEDIKANSQVWTQSITNRIEDLVKAVASGDKRAARDLISDLKIDAREFIRYIADDAGVVAKKPMGRPPVPIKLPKPQQPKPQQPSTEDPFKKIVTSPASVKEAYAVRSGKKNIREANPTAIKLAQKYNLTELKQLYSRAVNRRR